MTLKAKVRTPKRQRWAVDPADYISGTAASYTWTLYTNPNPTLATPTVESPSDGATGLSVPVTVKTSPPDPSWGEKHVDTRFNVYDPDTGDLLHEETAGEPVTEWSSGFTGATPGVYLPKPYPISYPAGDTYNYLPVVGATAGRVAYGTGSFDATEFEVFVDGTSVWTSGTLAYTTSLDLSAHADSIPHGSVTYRVRHREETLGWSAWSPESDSWGYEAANPETPSTTHPDGAETPEYPTILATAYASNLTESAVASRYRMYDASTGDVVYDSGEIAYTEMHPVPYADLPSDYRS